MIAKSVQHTHAQRRLIVQPGIGPTEFIHHFGRESISFCGSVDTDQKHGTANLADDTAIGMGLRVYQSVH